MRTDSAAFSVKACLPVRGPRGHLRPPIFPDPILADAGPMKQRRDKPTFPDITHFARHRGTEFPARRPAGFLYPRAIETAGPPAGQPADRCQAAGPAMT